MDSLHPPAHTEGQQKCEAGGLITTPTPALRLLAMAEKDLEASKILYDCAPGSRVGRWGWKGEEIDVVAVGDQEHGIVFGECTWGALDRREAKGVLTHLGAKAEMVRHDRYPKECYLLIGGSVEGKEDLRDEGYLVYDLADIEGFMRGE